MKRRKKYFTLIELMVVLVIIGVIGSIASVSFKGSIDKARQMKSDQNARLLQEILQVEMAQRSLTGEEVAQQWQTIIEESLFTANNDLTQDAYGRKYTVSWDREHNLFRINV